MKTASVSELKNSLSAFLEQVKSGHRVVVTDHQKPVAILEKASSHLMPGDLAKLTSRGLVTMPKRQLNVQAFLALPKARCSASLVQAVSEDREGR